MKCLETSLTNKKIRDLIWLFNTTMFNSTSKILIWLHGKWDTNKITLKEC